MTYTELQVTSHFSFLRGVSPCEELFAAAALFGYAAIGIVDRNSVAGLVRATLVSEQTGVRLVAGCRLDLMDGQSLLVWPESLAGWSNLTLLLSTGKARADRKRGEKGQCFLHWEDVASHADGLVAALVTDRPDAATAAGMVWMSDIFGAHGHALLGLQRRPRDAERLHRLATLAARHGLRAVAAGDVLYHAPECRLLQDVVTAIRNGCTIDDLGFRRERHADRHLKSPKEMARRFAAYPDAVQATADIADRCRFSLREIKYRYPVEDVIAGKTPQEALATLARNALADRFPGAPPRYVQQLEHELRLVEKMEYAPYFLTVNSIVSFARSQKILCQGRGSAANSIICFVLGITSIDPVKHELLFERFISEDRKEPPDIDIDFEHERREEVIQWIYDHYGRDRAALTAVISRFRARGAVREVGKVMGLPEDVTGALAGQVWGWSVEGVGEKHVEQLNLSLADERLALTLDLARQLIGTPRHLSQHPGGFVLTDAPLATIVPIEPAAMDERQVVEWEKEDIESLGLMKVDILGLGMLGCMRRAFDLLREHKGIDLDLASPVMQEDDEATFEMIQKADTLGVFQIESRAQMAMLPRMKPTEFYDLVIEVAIVRPGPIQGDMVHPYLKRRENREAVTYPNDKLKAVLKKTLGVPLFQEQAMKVAIEGAGFSPSEADSLRRAMATFKSTGGVGGFRDRLVSGMLANGITLEFAERLVKQIEGFGSYGFPESHAASFAKIAYASCWMKCHHPDIFCAALLNAQPMGFYAPAQIVRDAQEHGVEVLPPCVNESGWDCALLPSPPSLSLDGRGLRRLGSRPSRGPSRSWVRVEGAEDNSSRRHPQPAAAKFAKGLTKPTQPSPIEREGREEGEAKELLPLRLGLRMIRGLSTADGEAILKARAAGPFRSVEDVHRRANVPRATLEKLADADAFQCLGLDRRQALWQVRGLGERALPLFAAADETLAREPAVALRPLTEGREVVEDYRAIQLSLRAHPVSFLRPRLDALGVIPAAALSDAKPGRRVHVAGVILVRQKPGSAKGVLFMTIEDETGVANAVLWPDRFEAQRRTVLSASMVGIVGKVQREGQVIHVICDRVVDHSEMLREVGQMSFPHRPGPGDGATHGGSPDRGDPGWRHKSHDGYYRPFRTGADPEDVIRQKSRDFH